MLDETINQVLKKFLGANFELNDLKVNFVPLLPIFGISLRLKREVQKFVYSYCDELIIAFYLQYLLYMLNMIDINHYVFLYLVC